MIIMSIHALRIILVNKMSIEIPESVKPPLEAYRYWPSGDFVFIG